MGTDMDQGHVPSKRIWCWTLKHPQLPLHMGIYTPAPQDPTPVATSKAFTREPQMVSPKTKGASCTSRTKWGCQRGPESVRVGKIKLEREEERLHEPGGHLQGIRQALGSFLEGAA